jgi:prepilin-type N-terminal cleavage/methylation domain-containing protein/prepilin-type processing-associated H-X9-DG protein
MQRKRAFTLIELLVVIAIIAILAAILFPVFAKARERAKQSKSLNNIRQLALAVQQYSNDYNETFPGWVATNAAGTTFVHNTWDEQIDPFVKAKDVYTNGDTGIQSPSQSGAALNRTLTYCLNGLLITGYNNGNGRWTGTDAVAPLTASGLSNAANTILFAEVATNAVYGSAPAAVPSRTTSPTSAAATAAYKSALVMWIDIDPKNWVEQGLAANAYDESKWATNGAADKGVARDLYGGGACYAFCDGHVKFLKIAQTTTSGVSTVQPHNNWNPNAANNIIQYNMWYPN